MATTDADLALASLGAMAQAGIRYAVLHGFDRLAPGHISDVDLVVDRPPARLVADAAGAWWALGLRPVVFWPYDVGGAVTLFLATGDAKDAVQLDLLFDPQGLGEHGIRSAEILATTRPGAGVPVVSDAASLVYEWRKRRVKGQTDRFPALRDRAEAFDRDALVALSRTLTGAVTTALELRGELAPTRRRRRIHPAAELSRWVVRLREPIGFWAHVDSAAVARELSARFAAYLVHGSHTVTPGVARQVGWWARHVLPVRWRAGVVVSSGPVPHIVRPDVVVPDGDVELAAVTVTRAMSERLPVRS